MRRNQVEKRGAVMKGFSLVELMVAISVALILTATSLPAVKSSSDTYRLRNTAREVAAQCQNARFQAISSNTSHRLHLNGGWVELQKLTAGNYVTISSIHLSSTTVANPWSTDPVFSPRGTVTPVSITLSNNGGRQLTISLSLVGLVTIQ